MTALPLHRILYISTARQPMTQPDIAALLAQARVNNSRAGVTGLLLVGGRRFLQALEGTREAVETIYARIRADDRHHAVVTLADQPIAQPSFANWSMGFERGGIVTPSASLSRQVAELVAPVTDPTLRAYFTGFADTHGGAAA